MENGDTEKSPLDGVIQKEPVEEEKDYSWEKVPWIDRPSVDVAICLVIVLSAILMGVEQDSSEDEALTINDRLIWYVIEVMFGTVFIIELAARIHTHRWNYFNGFMNFFDVFMVAATILDTFILSPLQQGG